MTWARKIKVNTSQEGWWGHVEGRVNVAPLVIFLRANNSSICFRRFLILHTCKVKEVCHGHKVAKCGAITPMVGNAVQLNMGAGWLEKLRWERQGEEAGKESEHESPRKMESQPEATSGETGRMTTTKQTMSRAKHHSMKVNMQMYWFPVVGPTTAAR